MTDQNKYTASFGGVQTSWTSLNTTSTSAEFSWTYENIKNAMLKAKELAHKGPDLIVMTDKIANTVAKHLGWNDGLGVSSLNGLPVETYSSTENARAAAIVRTSEGKRVLLCVSEEKEVPKGKQVTGPVTAHHHSPFGNMTFVWEDEYKHRAFHVTEGKIPMCAALTSGKLYKKADLVLEQKDVTCPDCNRIYEDAKSGNFKDMTYDTIQQILDIRDEGGVPVVASSSFFGKKRSMCAPPYFAQNTTDDLFATECPNCHKVHIGMCERGDD